MSELMKFQHDVFGEIRVVDQKGEPWFIATDVAKALGYVDGPGAIKKHCKKVNKFSIVNSAQPYNIIPEQDVYRLIMRSNLPNAVKFQDWVCEEVLPSIRKTGSYSVRLPKTYAEALRELATAVEREEQLKLENAQIGFENSQMKPKADFYDTVTDSETAIDMGQTAKVLNMGIGRNYLFEFLRQQKVLMGNNVPYQSMIDAGYFRVIESAYTKPDGSAHINLKTVVYQKGVDYIRKLLLKFGDQEFHEEASDNFLP